MAMAMTETARSLEQAVLQLSDMPLDAHVLAEKKKLYGRVGQFLMGSFGGHWWCTNPSLMVFMLRILELYPATESVRVFYDKMAQQLATCTKCVDIYHASLPSVRVELEDEFTPNSIKAFFFKMAQLDADRIHRVLLPSANSGVTANGLIAPPPARVNDQMRAAMVITTLYEVLSTRRLLSDFRVVHLISKWLSSAPEQEKNSVDVEMLRNCAGMYHFLVSPDSGIRAWATSILHKSGQIDLSDESLEKKLFLGVLDEWMYILESSSFNVPVMSLDLPSTEDLSTFLEPTNCVKTPMNQILWAALDTVMQQMNETSLEAMLESFDNLPDLVFNYLNEADPATTNQQITFVICKCYGVLLRCLGHRFWRHSQHKSKSVLEMVMQHCKLPAWRVFVTKQLIELLPALLASMRPLHMSSSKSEGEKLDLYLKSRQKLISFLLDKKNCPPHFNDVIISVATSRAVLTIICDCYEPRLLSGSSSASGSENARADDGALPDSYLFDYSVSDSAFWWPCGVGQDKELGDIWMNHLFDVMVNPSNVPALVDHAAITCSTVLSKHLQLARDVVFNCILDTGSSNKKTINEITKAKPIITILLEKLCAWKTISTIPVTVHGSLFESLGGIAELQNLIVSQGSPSNDLLTFKDVLTNYEVHVYNYLQRISDEVLVKGLTNPLVIPVVAQHVTLCLISPNSIIDQLIKRLLINASASKNSTAKAPTLLESLIIHVHRNTEAFLRGVLSLLQSLRVYGFALPVSLPTVKKVIFMWVKVFEMLKANIVKVLDGSARSAAASQKLSKSGLSASANLQKLPNLISDFLVAILTNLYDKTKAANVSVDEPTSTRCLDFGVAFWNFWTSMDDSNAASKRNVGLIAPLVECIGNRSVAEKPRASELLMIMLEAMLQAQTPLDDRTLALVDSIHSVAGLIESKKSTDFKRMTKKFRQIDRGSRYFANRLTYFEPQSAVAGKSISETRRSEWKASKSGSKSLTVTSTPQYEENEWKSTKKVAKGAAATRPMGSKAVIQTNRPMSAKAAAKAQAQMAIDLTGIAETNLDSATWKQNHSFYDDGPITASRSSESSSAGKEAKVKEAFSMSKVLDGMAQTRPPIYRGESSRALSKTPNQEVAVAEKEEEDEDDSLNYAALFYRIKSTQKPIPECSLKPFFRQLLQLCMPLLLTRDFENERSDRTLSPPGLTFTKSTEYINAYLPLLLEECNNEVQEALRKCYFGGGKSPHVLRYESEKPREGMRCLNFTITQVGETSTNSFKFQNERRGKFGNTADKAFRNGDVVLFRVATEARQQTSDFMGKREFLGVILISEAEKGKRRSTGSKPKDKTEEDETVKVLFLNDGELETATSEVESFAMETLAESAIADSEWKVHCLCNLVTSAREYISLRSVDMLPEHLRTTILTPNVYKSTQTELLLMTTVLDDLRKHNSADAESKIMKLLKRLDKMDVTLMDLRSTSIGKAVNKLRKHSNAVIQERSLKLKEKWTALMNEKDALEREPRFLNPELWSAIRAQYNQSQLQSIHSVLNNYSVGVNLLQGPPGTGKTKTIMGLLSGLLALRPPMSTLMLSSNFKAKGVSVRAPSSIGPSPSSRAESGSSTVVSSRPPTPTFSLSGVTSALGSILRRTESAGEGKPTTIQSLKNTTSVRSRLEQKLSSRGPSSSVTVVKPRVSTVSLPARSTGKANNILLCAPSNGAVDELVLRIVTDGLMNSQGQVTKVRAPSVHTESISDEWLSIVRLGNPGIDAPDSVKAISLPNILKSELEIHPKTIELRALQDTQQTLRNAIREFHQKAKDGEGQKGDRKGLAKMHAQLTQCSGKVRRLRDEVFALRSKMTTAILTRASIIACTLSKAGSGQFSELQRGFDALIIDEAAQAVELSTLVPIRERVARVVLVGDPKQLPATVKSVVAANARYDRSLFERIAASGVAPSVLRVQYRMHPFLRDFPSKRFYGGLLTDGPSVMERVSRVCPGVYKHTCFQPFMVYDVDSQEEDMNGSKFNRTEAAFSVELCQQMFQTVSDVRLNRWSVGFVSPYKEQVNVIRREVTRSSIPSTVSVEVNTVDGFQGREKDVIIFSCVRSSRRGGIGFLKDIRRLNVAITRARFCLFVVGNVDTLVRDETWAALVQSAQERKLIISTRGRKFAEVARSIDTDNRSAHLQAHYKEMHEKASRKTAAASASADTEDTSKEAKQEKGKAAAADRISKAEMTSEEASSSSAMQVDTEKNTKIEKPIEPATDQKVEAEVSPEHDTFMPANVSPLSRDGRSPGAAAASARPRDSAASGHKRRADDQASSGGYKSVRPNSRDSSHSRRDDSNDRHDRSYSRDSSRSSDPYRRRDDRPSSTSSHPQRSSSTAPPPPRSISAKEFCMENEPTAPSPSARQGHIDAIMDRYKHDKRQGRSPTAGSNSGHTNPSPRPRPPRSDRFDPVARRSGDQQHRAPPPRSSSSSGPRQERRPAPSTNAGRTGSSGGGGVLGSILGSASQLASSTSRVQQQEKLARNSNPFM